jgi:hypothetical protein
MRVNFYVGPLVRFHSEKWKPVFIRGKSEQEQPSHSSPFEDESVSPLELRNYIIEWRKQISHALKRHLAGQLNWAETPETPFVTESMDRRGYDALRLWAAYSASSLTPPQMELPANVDEDPILIACEAKDKTDYGQIISHVVMWLPFNLDVVFETEFLNYEEPITVGSSGALFDQLKKLNSKTWNAPVGEITNWREAKIDENNLTLDSVAKFGFSVFYNMVQQSVMNKLPMALYH